MKFIPNVRHLNFDEPKIFNLNLTALCFKEIWLKHPMWLFQGRLYYHIRSFVTRIAAAFQSMPANIWTYFTILLLSVIMLLWTLFICINTWLSNIWTSTPGLVNQVLLPNNWPKKRIEMIAIGQEQMSNFTSQVSKYWCRTQYVVPANNKWITNKQIQTVICLICFNVAYFVNC